MTITVPVWLLYTLAVLIGVPALLALAFLVWIGWHMSKALGIRFR